jgi:hypothetical protein
MSDTMLERVAKAICESLEADIYEYLPERGVVKAAYRQQARAAIEAMRPPSPEMYTAAFEALVPASDVKACWEAMLSAALQPATDSEAAK